MPDIPNLTLVSDALSSLSVMPLVHGLQKAGWIVRLADAAAPPQAFAEARMPDAVVLHPRAEALRACVSQVRACMPDAILVAMSSGATAETRIAAMDAGADACCSADIQAAELAAMLRAVLRHRGQGARHSRWKLIARDRVLAGPADQWVPLTLAEGRLLKRLLHAPGWLLPRNDPTSGGGRALDVTVSRLRAKALDLGVQLPLFTVRDWGYLFLADSGAAGCE